MKLSLQTVCVVFGVTLVHLLFIAALSPGRGEAARNLGTVLPDASEPEFIGEEFVPVPAVERRRPVPTAVEGFDQPALRREEASVPALDPVAISRS